MLSIIGTHALRLNWQVFNLVILTQFTKLQNQKPHQSFLLYGIAWKEWSSGIIEIWFKEPNIAESSYIFKAELHYV